MGDHAASTPSAPELIAPVTDPSVKVADVPVYSIEETPAVLATVDAPEVGANEALLSFPDGSGKVSIHVDAEGRPHVIVPVTKATKAKVGAGIAAVAIGAQFGLDYVVPDDSPTGTALKVVLWAVGVAATALGIFLPKNSPTLKSKKS